jgi:dihydroorotate dehydrogenase
LCYPLSRTVTVPDWSYRTVLRPLLSMLPVNMARALALQSMGRLSRTAIGRAIIDSLGHMRPDPELRCHVGTWELPSPIGIGAGLDPAGIACGAFSQFGIGFLVIGPVTTQATTVPLYSRVPGQRGWQENGAAQVSLKDAIAPLQTLSPRKTRESDIRVFVLLPDATQEWTEIVAALADWVDAFVVPESVIRDIATDNEDISQHCTAGSPPIAVWGCVPLLGNHEDTFNRTWNNRFAGLFLETAVPNQHGLHRGDVDHHELVRGITAWRNTVGDEMPLLLDGGVSQPGDVLALMQQPQSARPDLIAIDTGLVDCGPGLIKRANEALVTHAIHPQRPSPRRHRDSIPQQSWFWLWLMGLSLFIGGIMAMTIAATRVVLPYDEFFVGMTRAEFIAVSPRLLPFLTHDRFTLAGTMLALGWLYIGLSTHAVRRGRHWAQVAMQMSAFAGFFSFFLFLGFGYFDPFHAFVTVVLLQFLLLSMVTRLGSPYRSPTLDLFEDTAWRRTQWGQLLYVIHGAVLIVAGCVISSIGATTVFVQEDLEFMALCAADLDAANPRLIPLIAHDRATFGGMLIATGVCVELFSLWGFRRGEAWQWWYLTIAGGVGYTAAIGIHLVVGYTSFVHLAPAIAGGAFVTLGSSLLYPYLCDRPQSL